MAKWEYCVINWTAGMVSAEQRADLEKAGFQGRLDEAEGGAAVAQLGNVEFLGKHDNAQIVDLGSYLAKLGADGWELVQVIATSGREQFWLKRPVN